MRWSIEKNKKSIISRDFSARTDRLEMSGEKVSCVVKYGEENGAFLIRGDTI